MATIIDALIVTLGLDPSNFRREGRKLEDEAKKQNEAAVKRGGEIEASAKKQREGFNALKGELLGLYAVFTGGKAIKAFITDTISGDAAVGRLAKNIGVSTEEIGAWQGVLRGVGGTSQDASNDLSLLASAAREIQLTGQSRLIPYLNLLHVRLSDLQNPTEALLKIADAFSKMDPRQAAELGRQMGFSAAMIATLEKGRPAVQAMVDEQGRLAPITAENARQAQALQTNIANLTTESGGLGRELLNNSAPALLDLLHGMQAVGRDKTFLGVMAAAGAACQAMGQIVKLTLDVMGGALRGLARLLSGDFSGAWDTAKKTIANAAKDIGGFVSGLWEAVTKLWDAMRGHPTGRPGAPGAQSAPPAQGAGAGAPPAATAAGGGRGTFGGIVGRLKAAGIGEAQAQGIAAGIIAESKGDPNAFNGTNGGNGAYGIGQWRGARQRELFRRYGSAPSLDQQLEFLVSELKGGDAGGRSVLQAGDAKSALGAYVNNFMRPGAAGAAGDLRRGQAALAANGAGGVTYASTSVTIGRVDVHTQATDAQGIAKSISPALRAAVPQANMGVS